MEAQAVKKFLFWPGQPPGFRHDPPPRRMRGYSLYEALVTTAVAGTITAGVIGLQPLLLDARLRSHVNLLFTDLVFARSEAVKRGQRVALCRSADGTACSDTARWQDGWVVFVDTNESNRREGGEDLLRVQTALPAGLTLRYGESGTITALAYTAAGNMTRDGTFTFCDPRGPSKARAIIIQWTGRARISARDPENRLLRCST
jgi:type IV fimbrial biogenesis protein FimT